MPISMAAVIVAGLTLAVAIGTSVAEFGKGKTPERLPAQSPGPIALPASREFARVVSWQHPFIKTYGLVDLEGNVVLRPISSECPNFRHTSNPSYQRTRVGELSADMQNPEFELKELLSKVCIKGRYGFVNVRGEFVVPAIFEQAYRFTDGLAAVRDDRFWGFVNVRGEFVVPAVYDAVKMFCSGLAAVKKDGRWGYVDTAGDPVVPAQFSNACCFDNDLAPCADSDGRWGLINKDGNWEIAAKYEEIDYLSEGLIAVKVDGKYGFINMDGEVVIAPQFDRAYAFSGGHAEVDVGMMTGLIDTSGAPVQDFKRFYTCGTCKMEIMQAEARRSTRDNVY